MARAVGKSAQYWSSFSPSNLPGLALWYDFSDRSTFDLSGEYQITRVRDKSGKGFHGTPSNPASNYWIYDSINNGVMRTPIGNAVNIELDLSLNSSVNSMSAAVAYSGIGTGSLIYVFTSRETGGMFFRSTTTGGYNAGAWSTSNIATASSIIDRSSMTVGSFTGGATIRVAGNGVVFGNSSTFVSSPLMRDGIPIILGAGSWTGTIRNSGSMYELLIFSNVLTDSERAATENYLINKWMTKPDAPPTIAAPTDISGCNLWLDISGGSSNFTFAAGTSNIVKWIDKSSNNYDVSTSGTSYPIWQDVSGYVYFRGGISTMNTARPEPSRGTETGFIVGIRGAAVLRNMIGTTPTGSAVGPYRQINSGGSTSYNIRVSNATPAITEFDPLESLWGSSSTSVPHELSWRIKGKEFFARTGGQAGAYKTTPNWIDISASSRTSIGNSDHYYREIVLYDRALSFSEMSNVSAYLTKKWGLSNYKTFSVPPPSNRPYASNAAFARPFQIPYDIPNCMLWLDAKDSNTLVLDSSSNVLMWYDKSGWQNDVSGGTSRPNYSNETIVFSNNSMTVRNPNVPASSNYRFLPGISMRYHTLIALHKPLTTTGNNQGNTGLLDFGFGYGTTTGSNISFPTMNGTTPRGYVNSTIATATRAAGTFLENSVTTEYNIISASVQSNRVTIYRNGVVQQDVSSVSGSTFQINGATAITSIGRWGSNNSNFYQGEVKELFVFDRALPAYSVAQIEAYLAKKWNFSSLLPSNHLAFSNAIPATVSVSPPAFEKIALWVDAMTYMGEYSNNATITTNWSNRAYSPSAVVPTGTPKFLSNAWQGRPGIDITSGAFSTSFNLDASLSSLSHQTFMVVSYNTGAPATDRTAMVLRAGPSTNPKHSLLQVRALDASMGSQFTNISGVSSGVAMISPPPVPAGSPFIFEVGATTSNMGWRANGNPWSNTATMTLTVTAYTWAGIGQDRDNLTTPTWDGNIHEIITFGSAPNSFDNQSRFRIRTYLARKWGILNLLPTYPDKGIAV